MNKTIGTIAGLCSCLVAACGSNSGTGDSTTGEGSVGQSQEAIVRADSLGGDRAAVAVVAQTIFGETRYCSGVYIAPRVVLTAAHCLPDIIGRTIVYYGPSVTADQAQFGPDDDPSKPWTVAETWARHPDYDADLHYPDFAVVYLQRTLPFEPAPLFRLPLPRSLVGHDMKIVGWGASKALTPDITQFEGVGLQRSARFPFLGSPTEADFVPADPNNGLHDPTIRARLAKFDGRAPESNSCAGDSGAPIFLSLFGRDYIGAINFFTGLSCEGYSMATRVEPFLPYIDDAILKGGAAPVTPILDCVDETEHGSLTAYFGYDNKNVVNIDIPLGRDNKLKGDDANVRPTQFVPGPHPWNFFVDFSKRDKLVYELDSPTQTCSRGDDAEKVTASSRAPRCGATDPQVSCARFCKAEVACGLPFADCMTDCLGNIPFFQSDAPQCLAPYAALNRCIAALPTDAVCNYSSPPSCVTEQAAFDNCFSQ